MACLSSGSDYGGDDMGLALPPTSFTEEGFWEEFVTSEEEGGNRKTMSVDLALHRESAYAQKVARLQLHQHSNHDESSLPLEASSLKLKHGADRTIPSENISSLVPSGVQQSYPKPFIQSQASESSSCSPPPQLQQSCAYPNLKKPLEEQQCLPKPMLKQSYPKNTTKHQPSVHLSNPPPVQLQRNYPNQTLQNQRSVNLSCFTPTQLQKVGQSSMQPPHPQQSYPRTPQVQAPVELSSLKRTVSEQSYAENTLLENLTSRLPTHLQQPYAMQSIQTQSSENLACIQAPPQQLSNARQTRQTPSSGNLSCILPLQMQQQSQGNQTLQTQSSESFSFMPPTQLQQSCTKPKFQIGPVSLVCKVCQVTCSSAFVLKKHNQGRKHRTKLEELRLQRRMRPMHMPNVGNEPVHMPNVGNEPLWCDICKIHCINEESYLQHVGGKKHMKHAARVQAINAAMAARGGGSFSS